MYGVLQQVAGAEQQAVTERIGHGPQRGELLLQLGLPLLVGALLLGDPRPNLGLVGIADLRVAHRALGPADKHGETKPRGWRVTSQVNGSAGSWLRLV